MAISFGFNLINITSVNEREETISFDGAVYMRWKDENLAFDPSDSTQSLRASGKLIGHGYKRYSGDHAIAEDYEGWLPGWILVNGIGDRKSNNKVVFFIPRVFNEELITLQQTYISS